VGGKGTCHKRGKNGDGYDVVGNVVRKRVRPEKGGKERKVSGYPPGGAPVERKEGPKGKTKKFGDPPQKNRLQPLNLVWGGKRKDRRSGLRGGPGCNN